MNILSATNPQWANAEHTAISLTANIEGIGVVPFNAAQNDHLAHGIALFNAAIAGDFGVIAPYVVAVPSIVSMRQARLVLLNAGLLPAIDAALSAMTGTTGEAARIEWEYAAEIRRDSPLVIGLSVSLGLTSTQLDELFIAAAAIV